MAPFVVASLAGGDFVLNPARATLNAGHKMLRGGWVQGVTKWRGAPDAIGAITLKNKGHALAPVELAAILLWTRLRLL